MFSEARGLSEANAGVSTAVAMRPALNMTVGVGERAVLQITSRSRAELIKSNCGSLGFARDDSRSGGATWAQHDSRYWPQRLLLNDFDEGAFG